jgi:hypothetical protein
MGDTETVCGATFFDCRCERPAGHDGEPHECLCEGSWTDDGDVLSLPNLALAGMPGLARPREA